MFDVKGDDSDYQKRNLSIKAKNSENIKLLEQWKKAEAAGDLKPGVEFYIKTWSEIAKKSKHKFRKYDLSVECEDEEEGEPSPTTSH